MFFWRDIKHILLCVVLLDPIIHFGIKTAAAENAQTLLMEGNKLFGEGDYAAAYEVYKKGYAIRPTPVFLRSMGFSLLKMFQHEKARKTLQQYIKKYPHAPDHKKISEIIQGLEVVVQTRVSISSSPSGAELYFDTEAAGKVGITPYTGTIEPGKHMIILKNKGFVDTVHFFTIQPRERLTLKLTMEVPLQVASVPSGATVHVDSPKAPVLGKTPLSTSIAPGKRTVYLTYPGYKMYSKSFNVTGKTPIEINAQLLLGIKIQSTPEGATVTLDDQILSGHTPLEGSITAGKHLVKVQLAGYKPFQKEIIANPGEPLSLHASLTGSLLSMRTNIDGAKINIDRRRIGVSPIDRAKVPLGQYTVSAHYSGRRTWSQSLDFREDEVIDVSVKLGGPMWPVWLSSGIALSGIVVGSIGAIIAKQRVDETMEDPQTHQNVPANVCSDGVTIRGNCSYSMHHMATAGFITAGVAAATGIIYYWFWGRPSQQVKRIPVASK